MNGGEGRVTYYRYFNGNLAIIKITCNAKVSVVKRDEKAIDLYAPWKASFTYCIGYLLLAIAEAY
ncbi:MAG: hypothetical protein QXN67_05790 [Thermoproteota archaeon]